METIPGVQLLDGSIVTVRVLNWQEVAIQMHDLIHDYGLFSESGGSCDGVDNIRPGL